MSPASADHDQAFLGIVSRLREKWTLEILSALHDTPQRFSDLKRRIGLNPNILTRSLRSLTHDGLVARLTWPSGLPRVEYELTPKGRRYVSYIEVVKEWSHIEQASAGPAERPPARAVGTPRRRTRQTSPHAGWAALVAAPLMHVGVVVRNVGHASLAFGRVFGLSMPPIEPGAVTIDGMVSHILLSRFRFPNFFVEFIEPVDGPTSPYASFIRRNGQGVHHLAFHVDRHDFDKRLDWLALQGGRCVAGGFGLPFADVDLEARLGTTIQLMADRDERNGGVFKRTTRPPEALSDGGHVLGRPQVTHVGIVVRDIARAVKSYVEIFGVQMPRVRLGTPRFPSDARASQGACAKLATIGHPNIAIQLIEPVGTSPMGDFLQGRDSAVHHIGFNVRRTLSRTIATAEADGGRRVLGRDGDPYAQIDLRSTIGLILEFTGSLQDEATVRARPA